MKKIKVNNKLYVLLLIATLIILLIGFSLYFSKSPTISIISEILRNLSYGGIASVVVAWLIENANVKEKNEELHNKYKDIYSNLKFDIIFYLESYARVVCLYNNDVTKRTEHKIWWEWFDDLQTCYLSSDEIIQKRIIRMICINIQSVSIKISEDINKLLMNEPFLKANNLLDNDLKHILQEIKFLFMDSDIIQNLQEKPDTFLGTLVSFNKDIWSLVDNWKEISILNQHSFEPYKFYTDSIYELFI